MQDDLRDRIRLNLTQRVGNLGYESASQTFGCLDAAAAAPPEHLGNLLGWTHQGAKWVCANLPSKKDAEREFVRAAKLGIRILSLHDTEVPEKLATLYDPPLVLYVRGEQPSFPDSICQPMIAIVGSRRATRYGLRQARGLGRTLGAAGVTVVSGLALGIDGEAHRGVIDSSGHTLAVLANGLDRIYPQRHENLGQQIMATNGGALVSELPVGTPPQPFQFPRRNRIITGLCDTVVVVEANEKSGSLVSASWATEQGRDVWAVPGPIDSRQSVGTNRLIRDGAFALTDPSDLLFYLGLLPDTNVEGKTNASSDPVLDALGQGALSLPEVVQTSGLPPNDVFTKLARFELEGQVRRCLGGMYERV